MEGMEAIGAFVEDTRLGAFLRELFPGLGDMQASVNDSGAVEGVEGASESVEVAETQLAEQIAASKSILIVEPTDFERADFEAGMEYIIRVGEYYNDVYQNLEEIKSSINDLRESGSISQSQASRLILEIGQEQRHIAEMVDELNNLGFEAQWNHNGDHSYIRSVVDKAYTSAENLQNDHQGLVKRLQDVANRRRLV